MLEFDLYNSAKQQKQEQQQQKKTSHDGIQPKEDSFFFFLNMTFQCWNFTPTHSSHHIQTWGANMLPLFHTGSAKKAAVYQNSSKRSWRCLCSFQRYSIFNSISFTGNKITETNRSAFSGNVHSTIRDQE